MTSPVRVNAFVDHLIDALAGIESFTLYFKSGGGSLAPAVFGGNDEIIPNARCAMTAAAPMPEVRPRLSAEG
jgi:hypothetical protein